jgi:hypothetical protein
LYGKVLILGIWLLFVCLQMSEPNTDSYDDERDGELLVALFAVDIWGSSPSGVSRRTMVETGIQWVERTLESSDDCFDMFRMHRTVFHRLHDTLVQNYGLVPSCGVSTMEATAIFLWACGGPQSFRRIRNKFGHSLETISRKFSEELNAIYRMSSDIIKPKDTNFIEIHPRLRESRFWPHFKDCIGAIDGSHFPTSVPATEQAKYIGCHGYASQNVMVVCDFDTRFTFVVTGWPGSVHDTRVLQDTLITYADRFPHPPEGITIFLLLYHSLFICVICIQVQIYVYAGKYYLVDFGYPNRKRYLAPYKGQKYHISEWQNARQPIGSKEVFNFAHSSLRNVIERSFGVLKMKWRILLSLPSFSLRKQSKIIIACMALHNFIRDSALHDRDFDQLVPTSLAHDVPVGESSSSTSDELDMSAFRDAIANAFVS